MTTGLPSFEPSMRSGAPETGSTHISMALPSVVSRSLRAFASPSFSMPRSSTVKPGGVPSTVSGAAGFRFALAIISALPSRDCFIARFWSGMRTRVVPFSSPSSIITNCLPSTFISVRMRPASIERLMVIVLPSVSITRSSL